jgi:hypothetical protein
MSLHNQDRGYGQLAELNDDFIIEEGTLEECFSVGLVEKTGQREDSPVSNPLQLHHQKNALLDNSEEDSKNYSADSGSFLQTKAGGLFMRKILTVLVFLGFCLTVLFAWNSGVALAFSDIEGGCLDCHLSGSTIVPDTKQFENGTSWHDFHKGVSGGNCLLCHPGSPGATPIPTVNCQNCHTTTCPWQDFHTSNQTYQDNVTGFTCAQCHPQCAQPLGDEDGDGIPDDQDNCPDTPNPVQEDTYPPQGNGIGDACDCESDFDCDGDVDADDVAAFLTDFGRFQFNNPCVNDNPCNGDFECDGDVDAGDVEKYLEDFGRFQFNNPCPACTVGAWCSY